MPFFEYRKMVCDVYKAIYDYFRVCGNLQNLPGTFLYFNSVFNLMNDECKIGWCGVELALYCIKSAIESMIDEASTLYTLRVISQMLDIVDRCQTIPPRIVAEGFSLIRDCTREIKTADQSERNLFLDCLKFVLKYIEDDKLGHYAAYCFQVLMDTVNTVEDWSLVRGLLDFYRTQKNTRK